MVLDKKSWFARSDMMEFKARAFDKECMSVQVERSYDDCVHEFVHLGDQLDNLIIRVNAFKKKLEQFRDDNK